MYQENKFNRGHTQWHQQETKQLNQLDRIMESLKEWIQQQDDIETLIQLITTPWQHTTIQQSSVKPLETSN